MATKALTDTLNALMEESEGDKISFGDVAQALNHRGFGPLLIAPALIGILPTGAIPLMPDILAAFIFLMSAQLIYGRKYPWIPKRLEHFSFDRAQYENAVKKTRPYTEWIDSFFHPRLKFLTGHIAQILIALLCIILSGVIILLSFIPFAASIPFAAVLLFGLALAVHDGLLTAIGIAFVAISFASIPFLWSSLPF
ncbi:MAG: exopolysaccharide biosynthesis protein exod [Micavibrio sp.]|nr:exopolysaccharide biosynthesis protein exod [Micavibrio sp.]|tara:strand:- start:153 stop:740 length:588 start_codon:yes stop_codon:yes gene_type:complete